MQERRELIPNTQTAERTEIQKPLVEAKLPLAAEPYQNYRGVATAEEGIRLVDYWRAIRKRLWLVIGIAVLITTLVAIYMSRRPDIFLATAQVQVDLEGVNQDLVSNERRAPVVNSDPAYFNTQLQILNSPSLLRRVVREIDLENNKEFATIKQEQSRSGFRSFLRMIGLASPEKKKDDSVPVSSSTSSSTLEDLAEAKRLQPFVEAVQKNLSVDPVREGRSTFKETRLINISYQHTNPELAAQVVNTIATVFTKNNQEKKFKTSGSTSKYLQDRVAELQTEIKRDEQRLAQNKKSAGVLELDEKSTVALQRLQGLSTDLLKAENERKTAEAGYNSATKPGALTALASEPARKFTEDTLLEINKLKQQRRKLEIEFQDEAPEIQEIDSQIAELEKKPTEYRRQVEENLRTNLQTNLERTRAQEAKVRAEYDRQYALAQGQNDAGINNKLLEQNISTKRGLLDNLLKQVRENDVVAVGTENNISVSDVAITPEEPIGPRRTMTVMMAFMLSLAFGCGLALFLEYLDDTVRTTDDVENYLRLPALAVIPTVDAITRRKLLVAGTEDNAAAKGRSELLISSDSRSALAEAYRQLRTSILLSTAGHAPKSLLVTSSVPSEGKTTTAVNTAISLAQTGAKVLIIDADMRRPRLHAIFQVSNEHGLSSILSNQLEEEEMLEIIQQDPETNLYLLPSGAVPPNPAELIGSEQMTRMLRIMEANFT
ncbi:MAG TPA: polysaccharide biosynthesis tyrosine autokinase, partial [Pyrinomonadaceae bacterium]|nr:polysaccharide biosynthesis tyrosine autokinase [Pyrinomonadaceae bacterium]